MHTEYKLSYNLVNKTDVVVIQSAYFLTKTPCIYVYIYIA